MIIAVVVVVTAVIAVTIIIIIIGGAQTLCGGSCCLLQIEGILLTQPALFEYAGSSEYDDACDNCYSTNTADKRDYQRHPMKRFLVVVQLVYNADFIRIRYRARLRVVH